MEYLKTFGTGERAEWQLERIQPVMYIAGRRIGVICQCLNIDADGNDVAPQVVGGRTLVAYVRDQANRTRVYWLCDDEFDKPRAARDAARAAEREAESFAWQTSDAGKAEAKRVTLERDYDRLHNDGAYGYNPHRGGDRPTYWPAEDCREHHFPTGA